MLLITAIIVTMALLYQVCYKLLHHQLSIFECMIAIREVYNAWRRSPSFVWIMDDLNKMTKKPWLAGVAGVILFFFIPFLLISFQNNM